MSCNCNNLDKNGKNIVDLVRGKGKAEFLLKTPHEIQCSCNKTFLMTTCVDKCPHCGMVYGVTPCSSSNKENILAADINY
ncbi:hypothetical protein SAMN02745196_00212 [Clostridium collagenovorans DSM 3089]|uniref:Uncharacterized protein n=1 Tax=Clostridium collagenovorans DSM 3089 TaxID=1121306 RepID=A0A1M5SL26_9CLOT|nr:hypothetical protein [Clostridium collagenovorans]SHH39211.1 hypothetical protein SAMN02745196_00212 [Clostridium collagenovorans DSM 3089]